ncbi:predicted protein [Phaeodactylum tricornutum CCAP 1055/1]|uniref:PPIase cyclophilin-type domain-containing protein n=1 Tax=Phaeodactylum tricornutum (strain CCAP 1055/1) TaxID=556484 RepID=B7G4C1_PHATC|nr:predicted protein [Phaeodactylum tricornutum CCAP 1055/1]EEC46589.1 predicted protein [Phaeodactylum tricornutum CCAP 1055/1]|eukprot:XP_002182049.1 predicted protein [Phaeodactylum tricornutum CCAP 1055/1]
MPRLGGGSSGQTPLLDGDDSGGPLPLTQTLSSLRLEPTQNLSIVPEKTRSERKTPIKFTSFQMPRISSSSSDHAPMLPDRSPEAMQSVSLQKLSQRSVNTFRAAEHGKVDILPISIASSTFNRKRAVSSNNMSSGWYGQSSMPQSERPMPRTQSLRSRRSSSKPTCYDDEQNDGPDKSVTPYTRHVRHGWEDADFGSPYKLSHKSLRRSFTLNKAFLTLQLGHFLQLAVVIVVSFLVFDSYHRAITTTDQLSKFKNDESMLLLHLHRVEQQALNLHEEFDRLSKKDFVESHSIQNEDGRIERKNAVVVDSELIRKQTQQLRQMEEELSHEVRALQESIQIAARSCIVRTFGEGPVQVILDLNFGERNIQGGTKLTILLWYDTPHAAWTLLEQIRKGIWDGASFRLDKGRSIAAAPENPDRESKLEFIEHSQKNHDPWTIGLSDFGDDGIGLFVNLKDNSAFHKQDVCVGKIIDGFDALQQLVDLSRSRTNKISIAAATASHLTREHTSGLV